MESDLRQCHVKFHRNYAAIVVTYLFLEILMFINFLYRLYRRGGGEKFSYYFSLGLTCHVTRKRERERRERRVNEKGEERDTKKQ